MTEQTNNRQSQLGAYVAIATTGAGAIAVAAIANTITGAIDSLPAATTAGIVTSLPVALTAMCGFSSIGAIGAAAFIVAWRTPRATAQRQYRDDDERMIVASPRPAQIQAQQIRQLPPPPMPPNEPRFAPFRGDIANMVQREQQRATYTEDAQQPPEIATFTSDYGYQPQYADDVPQTPTYAPQNPEPPPIATNQRIIARLGNGSDINIAAAAWLAFVSLDKPNRDDWRLSLKASGNSAPNSDYGKCKTIADEYRLLSGAGCWISPKMRDTITQWLTKP